MTHTIRGIVFTFFFDRFLKGADFAKIIEREVAEVQKWIDIDLTMSLNLKY